MMAAPFSPPSSSGKPEVPTWIPPEPTQAELDWAPLHTIDLSELDSPSREAREGLVRLTKTALARDGFLYVTNYGVSAEQLQRQFSLAQYTHRNISAGERARLRWDPSTGSLAGFKRRYGWRRERGEPDGIEHFNFYRGEFADPRARVPACLAPFMDEITAFCEYLTHSVNRRLLRLLSRVLELPDDYLWDHVQSHDGPVGEGYFRHALFYPLLDPADQARRDGVRMYGHTDYGTTTLLFSVPVTGLQVWNGAGKKWQAVQHRAGALIVNVGESLEIVSGGHFRATTHKVAAAPRDQAHHERLSLVQFNAAVGARTLAPAWQSPLLQREGVVLDRAGVFSQYQRRIDAGAPLPTSRQWREANISTRVQTRPEDRAGGVQEIDGVQYGVDEFLGVPVLLPV